MDSPLAAILKVATGITLAVALTMIAWHIAFGRGGAATSVDADTGSAEARERVAEALTSEASCRNVFRDRVWRDGRCVRAEPPAVTPQIRTIAVPSPEPPAERSRLSTTVTPPPTTVPPTTLPPITVPPTTAPPASTTEPPTDERDEPDEPEQPKEPDEADDPDLPDEPRGLVDVWLSHEVRCTDCNAIIATVGEDRKIYYRQTVARTLKADEATLPTHRSVRPGGIVRIPVTVDTTNVHVTTHVTLESVYALDHIPGGGGRTYCEEGARDVQHGFADAGGHMPLGVGYGFVQHGLAVGSSVTLSWEPGDGATKWAVLQIYSDVTDGGVVCLKLTPAAGAQTSATKPVSTMFSVKVCGWRFVPEDNELAFKSIFDPDPVTGACPEDQLPEFDLDTRQLITRPL